MHRLSEAASKAAEHISYFINDKLRIRRIYTRNKRIYFIKYDLKSCGAYFIMYMRLLRVYIRSMRKRLCHIYIYVYYVYRGQRSGTTSNIYIYIYIYIEYYVYRGQRSGTTSKLVSRSKNPKLEPYTQTQT